MATNQHNTPQIDYEMLVEESLRSVVRSALAITEEYGLDGDTHFFITFLTSAEGVDIAPRLIESHPERMTIVLQHQYWDLRVADAYFTVTLTFGGVAEKLVIPFAAVVDFNDPSVGFGLQFAHESTPPAEKPKQAKSTPPAKKGTAKSGAKSGTDQSGADQSGTDQSGTDQSGTAQSGTAQIVSLDAWRKKS